MATATVTNTFADAAATSASEMNQNFTDVETFMNSSSIHKDGSKAFSGDWSLGSNKLTNVSDPAAATDAATKAYVDQAGAGSRFSYTTWSYASQSDVPYDTEDYDVAEWGDPLVSETDFTTPVDGLYRISIGYTTTITSDLSPYLWINDQEKFSDLKATRTYNGAPTYSYDYKTDFHLKLNEGDTISVRFDINTSTHTHTDGYIQLVQIASY